MFVGFFGQFFTIETAHFFLSALQPFKSLLTYYNAKTCSVWPASSSTLSSHLATRCIALIHDFDHVSLLIKKSFKILQYKYHNVFVYNFLLCVACILFLKCASCLWAKSHWSFQTKPHFILLVESFWPISIPKCYRRKSAAVYSLLSNNLSANGSLYHSCLFACISLHLKCELFEGINPLLFIFVSLWFIYIYLCRLLLISKNISRCL